MRIFILFLPLYIYIHIFFLESDLIPGLATFFACLVLPLEIGVLIGIGLNLVSILYHAARPKLLIEVHKVCKRKMSLLKHSFICYKIKTIILTDTRWYKLFDGHAR